MARIISTLVAIATCAFATVNAGSYFKGFDGNLYVAYYHPRICGPNYDGNGPRVVARSHHFCADDNRKHSLACTQPPIHNFLDYSRDYLKKGFVPIIGCTKEGAYMNIADLKFQRHFLSLWDGDPDKDCVWGDPLGDFWLCFMDDMIYATNDPYGPHLTSEYDPKTSFGFFQKARHNGLERDDYDVEELKEATSRIYPGKHCAECGHYG